MNAIQKTRSRQEPVSEMTELLRGKSEMGNVAELYDQAMTALKEARKLLD